jgi:hypothetical protein
MLTYSRRLVDWPETAFDEITPRFPQGDLNEA